MRISLVVPTLNEAEGIGSCLANVQPWRLRGHEIILADGGSEDGTLAAAEGLADRIVQSPRGRARQMNAGARQAQGEVLLFLHADTAVPATADAGLLQALEASGLNWGRFNVRLSGTGVIFRLTERLMNLRSRLTNICTGDQAIFVKTSTFFRIGGFRDLALMEDIDISRRLKTVGPALCLTDCVLTSSRRWEENGPLRTTLTMWSLRLAFFLGCSPERLARIYYRPDRQRGGQQA